MTNQTVNDPGTSCPTCGTPLRSECIRASGGIGGGSGHSYRFWCPRCQPGGTTAERAQYGYSCSFPIGLIDHWNALTPASAPELERWAVKLLKTRFAAYKEPPCELPAEFVIVDVVRQIIHAAKLPFFGQDDKTQETCRAKFSTIENFDREPYIPVPETQFDPKL